MLENYETILIPEEVCEILRIGQNKIYKLLNSGCLAWFFTATCTGSS